MVSLSFLVLGFIMMVQGAPLLTTSMFQQQGAPEEPAPESGTLQGNLPSKDLPSFQSGDPVKSLLNSLTTGPLAHVFGPWSAPRQGTNSLQTLQVASQMEPEPPAQAGLLTHAA